jgi:hypothetical protein
VNQKTLRIFTAECRRALTVLDAGQGVNEVIWQLKRLLRREIKRRRLGEEQPRRTAERSLLQSPSPKLRSCNYHYKLPLPSAADLSANVASCPSPAPEPSPIPSIQPPQPARQPGASGSNKRRKTRAEKRQIPAASNIPPIPESQPAPST